jgi:hypothetical protein
MHKTIAPLLICCLFFSTNLFAQSADEKKVAERLETLLKELLTPDKATLENLAADELSYCHSTGLLEDKAAFVDDLLKGKTVLTSVTISDQTIKIAGDAAIVRQHLTGETNHNNVVAKIDIIVLLVWQKQKGEWKLLARQAAKIPPSADAK